MRRKPIDRIWLSTSVTIELKSEDVEIGTGWLPFSWHLCNEDLLFSFAKRLFAQASKYKFSGTLMAGHAHHPDVRSHAVAQPLCLRCRSSLLCSFMTLSNPSCGDTQIDDSTIDSHLTSGDQLRCSGKLRG